MTQKDSKKSVAKKLKSTKKLKPTKKSVAKKGDSRKKGSQSELKKLVAKAEKRAAKSTKSVTAEATTPKKQAVKKQAVKNGADARRATPVRTRRAPATTSDAPSSAWNVLALRAHARAAGVVGYSRMKKDDLLAHLAVY